MNQRPIDQHAPRIPQDSRLPPCLYVPVAARDTDAIETYVGKIIARLATRSPHHALLIDAHELEKADVRLPIWGLPEAAVLHYPRQVWVHVDYGAYRRAFIRAFPNVNLTGLVLDHVMNRRVPYPRSVFRRGPVRADRQVRRVADGLTVVRGCHSGQWCQTRCD